MTVVFLAMEYEKSPVSGFGIPSATWWGAHISGEECVGMAVTM
jgi:hypothetical protein